MSATSFDPRITTSSSRFPQVWPTAFVAAAPLVAVLAGLAAEFLDFRALRYPLLLVVFAGVLASSLALSGRQPAVQAFVLTVVLGAATWAAAETLYVVIHAGRGASFETERFSSEPAKAVWLIAVHGILLGLPTGVAAAIARHLLATRS